MPLEKGNVGPMAQINCPDLAGGTFSDGGGNSALQGFATQTSSSVDSFYEKLSKLFESSGLSLLFNFRETSLDLYVFYKEVTERGGFQMVTKDGKWGEVASTLNSKSIVLISPTQLQKLYANLLYQFEQTYYYRTPAKVAASSGHPSGDGSSTGKRKHSDISQLSTVHFGPNSAEQKLVVQTPPKNQDTKKDPKLVVQISPKNKDTKKDPNAPIRSRSAYQLFLRKECDRLKKIHGETSASQNTRDMAIDAWRTLSETDRQPYVEESRKDKERFKREITAYKEGKSYNLPWHVADGDYHVTLQSAPENFFIQDESAVGLTSGLMKNVQPNDALYQINFDEYCGSLDILS